MAVNFTEMISNLEALKNDLQALIYRIQESQREIQDNSDEIAEYVIGSQNGPMALELMQAADDELNNAVELASDAIAFCEKDIGSISTH